MDAEELLDIPLNTLGLSDEFNQQCTVMKYKTLRDITSQEPMEIINKKGFNYNWLGELVKYLSKHGQIHLLQPFPGKVQDKSE